MATDLHPAEPTPDRERRGLLKSAVGLAVATSLGPYGASALAADAAPAPWGDPATLVTAIGAGTLSVPNLAESVAAYTRGFGYVEHWRGPIPRDVAAFWGTPGMAGRAAAVIGPPDIQRGMIRIVELGKDFQKVSLRETLGWLALEIQVRSPQDLAAQLKGLPFTLSGTGVPGEAKDPEGRPLYRAVNFTGPSGEPLNMTQHMQLDALKVSTGRNNVGPLFIQTLAAYPYPEVRDLYAQTLRMKMRMEINTRRPSRAGQQAGESAQMLKMSAVRSTDYCSIEIDEVPQGTPQRPAGSGLLPPGVSMCTLTTRNLDAVKDALGKAKVRFAELKGNTCPPFSGARILCFQGRAGERVEIVEAGKA